MYSISPQELAEYEKFIHSLNVPGDQIPRVLVQHYMAKSSLSREILKNIWNACKQNIEPTFSRAEFIAVIHLVCLAKRSISLPSLMNIGDIANRLGHSASPTLMPHISSSHISSSHVSSSHVPRSNIMYNNVNQSDLQIRRQQSLNLTDEISDEQKRRYCEFFEKNLIGNIKEKLINLDTWRLLNLSTTITQNELEKIFILADLDKDRHLNKEEFYIAMHIYEKHSMGTPIPTFISYTLKKSAQSPPQAPVSQLNRAKSTSTSRLPRQSQPENACRLRLKTFDQFQPNYDVGMTPGPAPSSLATNVQKYSTITSSLATNTLQPQSSNVGNLNLQSPPLVNPYNINLQYQSNNVGNINLQQPPLISSNVIANFDCVNAFSNVEDKMNCLVHKILHDSSQFFNPNFALNLNSLGEALLKYIGNTKMSMTEKFSQFYGFFHRCHRLFVQSPQAFVNLERFKPYMSKAYDCLTTINKYATTCQEANESVFKTNFPTQSNTNIQPAINLNRPISTSFAENTNIMLSETRLMSSDVFESHPTSHVRSTPGQIHWRPPVNHQQTSQFNDPFKSPPITSPSLAPIPLRPPKRTPINNQPTIQRSKSVTPSFINNNNLMKHQKSQLNSRNIPASCNKADSRNPFPSFHTPSEHVPFSRINDNNRLPRKPNDHFDVFLDGPPENVRKISGSSGSGCLLGKSLGKELGKLASDQIQENIDSFKLTESQHGGKPLILHEIEDNTSVSLGSSTKIDKSPSKKGFPGEDSTSLHLDSTLIHTTPPKYDNNVLPKKRPIPNFLNLKKLIKKNPGQKRRKGRHSQYDTPLHDDQSLKSISEPINLHKLAETTATKFDSRKIPKLTRCVGLCNYSGTNKGELSIEKNEFVSVYLYNAYTPQPPNVLVIKNDGQRGLAPRNIFRICDATQRLSGISRGTSPLPVEISIIDDELIPNITADENAPNINTSPFFNNNINENIPVNDQNIFDAFPPIDSNNKNNIESTTKDTYDDIMDLFDKSVISGHNLIPNENKINSDHNLILTENKINNQLYDSAENSTIPTSYIVGNEAVHVPENTNSGALSSMLNLIKHEDENSFSEYASDVSESEYETEVQNDDLVEYDEPIILVAKEDFVSENVDLQFKEGDILYAIASIPNHYCVEKIQDSGILDWVSTSYFNEVSKLSITTMPEESEREGERKSSGTSVLAEIMHSKLNFSDNDIEEPIFVIAHNDYTDESRMITFKTGDVIQVDNLQNNIYYGFVNGVCGDVPATRVSNILAEELFVTEQSFQACKDHNKSSDYEIDIVADSNILVYQINSSRWSLGRNEKYELGWFPPECIYEENNDDIDFAITEQDTPIAIVRCLDPYTAELVDELSFNAGDIIQVYDMSSDWWLGKLNDSVGMFPSNFVTIINKTSLPNVEFHSAQEDNFVVVVVEEENVQKTDEPIETNNFIEHNNIGENIEKGVVKEVIEETTVARRDTKIKNLSTRADNVMSIHEVLTFKMDAIEELISTESKYLYDLNQAIDIFYNPMLNSGIISKDELDEIFLNWRELMSNSLDFSNQLHRWKLEHQSFNKLPQIIEDNFNKLDVYFTYFSEHNQSVSNYTKLLNNNYEFCALEKACMSQLKASEAFALLAFLIKPLQRLTKYPLFMREIIKSLPEDNPTMEHFRKNYNIARDYCDRANDVIRQQESMSQLVWLQDHLSFEVEGRKMIFSTLIAEGVRRNLILYELVQKKKNGKNLVIIIFNDFLALATYFPSSIPKTIPFEGYPKNCFTLYKEPIHLKNLKYVYSESNANNEITLKCNEYNYSVTLKASPETIKAIASAIDTGKEDYSRFSVVNHMKSSNYDSKSLTGHLKITIQTLNHFPRDVLYNDNVGLKVCVGLDEEYTTRLEYGSSTSILQIKSNMTFPLNLNLFHHVSIKLLNFFTFFMPEIIDSVELTKETLEKSIHSDIAVIENKKFHFTKYPSAFLVLTLKFKVHNTNIP